MTLQAPIRRGQVLGTAVVSLEGEILAEVKVVAARSVKKDSVYNMVYRLDAMEAYNKKLVKRIAVKGISVSGSTATEGYVYLEGINLSKGNPTATIEFDVKRKVGVGKVRHTVSENYNISTLSQRQRAPCPPWIFGGLKMPKFTAPGSTLRP